MKHILVKTLKAVFRTLFVVYGIVPAVMFIFPQIHHTFLFMHLAKWPFTNYTNPQRLGVNFTSRNFYIETDKNVKIGVWHVLPKSLNDVSISKAVDFERLLSESNKPIVVYYHGNTWTRAAPHRIYLYNVLASADYHVLSLDYRGYGDSSGSPTEEGVVKDAVTLFKWAKERAGDNPVFVWGHSLGTAIGTKAVKDLCKENNCPQGLVLESPFTNLKEIIRFHPFTIMFRWLPWFDHVMVRPFQRLSYYFNTDERIRDVQCPIMIMHAKDDRVVPFQLAEKLKFEALNAGRDVTFIEFEEEFNYGHKYICSAPELPDIVYEFFQKCLHQS